MTRLVVVVPLGAGTHEEAQGLLAEGPPFDLDTTRFDRHAAYLTNSEALFVFEGHGESRSLDVPGEDPDLWRAARAWQGIAVGRPRVAETAFSWDRDDTPTDRR